MTCRYCLPITNRLSETETYTDRQTDLCSCILNTSLNNPTTSEPLAQRSIKLPQIVIHGCKLGAPGLNPKRRFYICKFFRDKNLHAAPLCKFLEPIPVILLLYGKTTLLYSSLLSSTCHATPLCKVFRSSTCHAAKTKLNSMV
jgi:hypothetical protein